MFRRLMSEAFDLGGTISIGPYSVVRLGRGLATTGYRTRRYFMFIPIVGLFDDRTDLVSACIVEIQRGNCVLLQHADRGYQGGVMLDFVAGASTYPENLMRRAIGELAQLR